MKKSEEGAETRRVPVIGAGVWLRAQRVRAHSASWGSTMGRLFVCGGNSGQDTLGGEREALTASSHVYGTDVRERRERAGRGLGRYTTGAEPRAGEE